MGGPAASRAGLAQVPRGWWLADAEAGVPPNWYRRRRLYGVFVRRRREIVGVPVVSGCAETERDTALAAVGMPHSRALRAIAFGVRK